MRRSIVFFLTAPLLVPMTALAASTDLGSTTILRIEQQTVTGQPKQTLLPATQFLSIDSSDLGDGNLSLHLAGWGRVDLADKSTYAENSVDGSFTYGYLRYRLRPANTDLRAGRFFVREGIISEQVDGVSARTDLPYGFSLSAFGGAPVHTRHLYGTNTDGKGNLIYGGRAAYRYSGQFELGFSGLHETDAPSLPNDINGNPRPNEDHRLVGGDIWLSPIRFVELFGQTSYNTATSKIAEQTYLLNLKPVKHLVLTGEFNEHRELSYLGATWARFPGVLSIAPNEKTRTIGTSASYAITPAVEVAVDYKNYKREFGSANRYGGDLKLNFQKNTLSSGFGFHHLQAGEGYGIGYRSDGITKMSGSYNELRAYVLHDAKDHFVALDGISYIFKEAVDGEKSAWEAKLSAGYYLTPTLVLSGDISYGRNPESRDETKGLLRLTYNTTFDGKGGKK